MLAAAADAVAAARQALAAGVAAGDAVELSVLGDAARAAVAAQDAAAADAYDRLADDLGAPWRPTPPVVELLTLADARGRTVGLLLDLPEPLPWERVGWTLVAPGASEDSSLRDLVLAWSGDGARAILVRDGAKPFASGLWSLRLTMHLDVGAECAVWRRGGSTAPEVGSLSFTL